MYKILIVEDDNVIAETLKKQLELWGYEVLTTQDFKNVKNSFVKYDPQLVLMDISLPFFNGFHWCNEIRKTSKVPIIFLSSASDNMSIVIAMNMGGDDFISKPFDLNVLMAKVQAILRRTYDFAAQSSFLEYRGAMLNVSNGTLDFQGARIDLTKNEFRILKLLMESKGKTVTRETLMTELWETDSYVDENTLTVNVTRLRKRLEAAGLENFIVTKKGLGYLVE